MQLLIDGLSGSCFSFVGVEGPGMAEGSPRSATGWFCCYISVAK